MAVLSRSRVAEGMLGAGSTGALLLAMASIDETFRERLAVLARDPWDTLSVMGARAQRVVRMAMETVGYQGSEHAWLAAFAAVALGLVLFTVWMSDSSFG